jgi:uncharacterized protein
LPNIQLTGLDAGADGIWMQVLDVGQRHPRTSLPQARRPDFTNCCCMQVGLTTEERNWAMAAHLSALIAFAGLPFGHVVGPLIVYIAKGRESTFVGEHARASLNYQLTISLVGLVAVIVGMSLFFSAAFGLAVTAHVRHASDSLALGIASLGLLAGVVVLACIGISIVFIIIGTIAASDGRLFTYPFAIRFLR